MKKIVKRRKSFRINNPLAFGILCAMIFVVIGGGIYALTAGLAVPAVKNYQLANATPSPTPTEAPATPTPGVATPSPTPSLQPGATPTPSPTPAGGALAGRIIGIDPARGYSSKIKGVSTGIYANRLNYAVATLVKEQLETLGAKVVVPLASVKSDMDSDKRAEVLNSGEVELAVRIECNYVDTKDTRGAIVWTNGKHAELAACDKLAAAVLAGYLDESGFTVQKYNGESIRHREDDSFLTNVKAPACTLIMGYISNADDDKALNDAAFQKKIANGIVNGILAYLGAEV